MSEMLYSIEKKKKHRCSGELSHHVLDLIESTMYSARTNKPKKIDTTCKIPKIFTAKEINKIRNVGYPISVIVSKKKDKYGVLMDSTQLKSFHNDISPLMTILRLFTRFRR